MMLVGALVILACLGAIGLSIRDARTLSVTDTYQLATTNVTTASVQLTKELWDDDITRIELTSNTTADVPIVSSYNSTTRNLALTGLDDNTTRTFEVQYYTAGFTDYPFADTGIRFVPTILVIGIILVIFAAIWVAWTGRGD